MQQPPQRQASGALSRDTEVRLMAYQRLQNAQTQAAAEGAILVIENLLNKAIEQGPFSEEDLGGRVLASEAARLREEGETVPPERIVPDIEEQQARQEHEQYLNSLRSSLRDQRRAYRAATNTIIVLDQQWGEELKIMMTKLELEMRQERLRRESGLERGAVPV